MDILAKFKERAKRAMPLAMGLSMIAAAGMALATGQAAAAGTNGTAAVWWEQYNLLTYVFGALTVVFGIATVWMKDFRLALVTVLVGVLALLSVYVL